MIFYNSLYYIKLDTKIKIQFILIKYLSFNKTQLDSRYKYTITILQKKLSDNSQNHNLILFFMIIYNHE